MRIFHGKFSVTCLPLWLCVGFEWKMSRYSAPLPFLKTDILNFKLSFTEFTLQYKVKKLLATFRLQVKMKIVLLKNNTVTSEIVITIVNTLNDRNTSDALDNHLPNISRRWEHMISHQSSTATRQMGVHIGHLGFHLVCCTKHRITETIVRQINSCALKYLAANNFWGNSSSL